MGAKTQQLQIRVTAEQKAALQTLARRAGQAVSEYVLGRALPPAHDRLLALTRSLTDDRERRFALAELNDLLARLAPIELARTVARADLEGLSPYLQNYVAAMVEQACHEKGVRPPAWLAAVQVLERPHFPVPFPSLRPHLLRTAPVPFKRRNIFVDSALGDRV